MHTIDSGSLVLSTLTMLIPTWEARLSPSTNCCQRWQLSWWKLNPQSQAWAVGVLPQSYNHQTTISFHNHQPSHYQPSQPSALTPSALTPSALTLSALILSALTTISPHTISPHTTSPHTTSPPPLALTPLALTPPTLTPSASHHQPSQSSISPLTPSALTILHITSYVSPFPISAFGKEAGYDAKSI